MEIALGEAREEVRLDLGAVAGFDHPLPADLAIVAEPQRVAAVIEIAKARLETKP